MLPFSARLVSCSIVVPKGLLLLCPCNHVRICPPRLYIAHFGPRRPCLTWQLTWQLSLLSMMRIKEPGILPSFPLTKWLMYPIV